MRRRTWMAATAASMLMAPAWHASPAQPGENPLQLAPHHVVASVADMDKETAWYERVFGFKEILRSRTGSDYEIRQLAMPNYRIDFVWQKGSVRHPSTSPFSNQGWVTVVFKTALIDADYQKLVADGTDVKADRNARSAITRLVVHDPEGNEIEIVPQLP